MRAADPCPSVNRAPGTPADHGSQLANLHRRADAEGHALAEAHDYGLRCAAA